MIKHIVFFKLPQNFEQKDLFVSKLNGLKDKIDFIRGLEVGVDFLQTQRSFDICLTVLLDSKEALSQYTTHEHHLPVVEFVQSNGIEAKAVDYELPKSCDSDFSNATIVKQANQYFDGQVTSRTVIEADGTRKTLGIMMPGSYTFGTEAAEHMEILAGHVEVELPGAQSNCETIKGGEYFEVPANSSFDIKVLEVTDYCCTYIK
jgi:uncharacterized protein YaiE (UPF0345 family)